MDWIYDINLYSNLYQYSFIFEGDTSEDNVVIKENHLPAAGQALTWLLVLGGVTCMPGRKYYGY
jgi:hypothetical protein